MFSVARHVKGYRHIFACSLFLHGIYRYIFEFDMTGFYSKIIRYRIHIYNVLRLFNYKYKNVTKMNTVNNALIMTHLLILKNL